jgi:hypothetical protein
MLEGNDVGALEGCTLGFTLGWPVGLDMGVLIFPFCQVWFIVI